MSLWGSIADSLQQNPHVNAVIICIDDPGAPFIRVGVAPNHTLRASPPSAATHPLKTDG